MKLTKKIFLVIFTLCLTLGFATFAFACTNKNEPETPTTYSVTYLGGECDGTAYAGESAIPTETAKAKDATFTLAQALVWEGYTFKGWNDGTSTYNAGATYTMPASAVTLTATWEKDEGETPTTYSVTYLGGECDGTAYAGESAIPTETAKAKDATFTLAAALVWEGYTFKGWNDGTDTYDAGATYTMPASAVTLTATWEKDEPETLSIPQGFWGEWKDSSFDLTIDETSITTDGTVTDIYVKDGKLYFTLDGSKYYLAIGTETDTLDLYSNTLGDNYDKETTLEKVAVKETDFYGHWVGSKYSRFEYILSADGFDFYDGASSKAWIRNQEYSYADEKISFSVGYDNYTIQIVDNVISLYSGKSLKEEFAAYSVSIPEGFVNTWIGGTYVITFDRDGIVSYSDSANTSDFPAILKVTNETTLTCQTHGSATTLTLNGNQIALSGSTAGGTDFGATLRPVEYSDFEGKWYGTSVKYASTLYELHVYEDHIDFFNGGSGKTWHFNITGSVVEKGKIELTNVNGSFYLMCDGANVNLYDANNELVAVLSSYTLEIPTQFQGHWVGGKFEIIFSEDGIEYYYDSSYAKATPYNDLPVGLKVEGDKLIGKIGSGEDSAEFAISNGQLTITTTGFGGGLQDTLIKSLGIDEDFWGTWYDGTYTITINEHGIVEYKDKTLPDDQPKNVRYEDGKIYLDVEGGYTHKYLEIKGDNLEYNVVNAGSFDTPAVLKKSLGLPQEFWGTWVGTSYSFTLDEHGIADYANTTVSDDSPTKVSYSAEENRLYVTVDKGEESGYLVVENETTLKFIRTFGGSTIDTLTKQGIVEIADYVGHWANSAHDIYVYESGTNEYTIQYTSLGNPYPMFVVTEYEETTEGIKVTLNNTQYTLVLNGGKLEMQANTTITLDKVALTVGTKYHGHWVGETYDFTVSADGFSLIKKGELECYPVQITVADDYLSCRVVNSGFGMAGSTRTIYIILNDGKLEIRSSSDTSADTNLLDTCELRVPVKIADYVGLWENNNHSIRVYGSGTKYTVQYTVLSMSMAMYSTTEYEQLEEGLKVTLGTSSYYLVIKDGKLEMHYAANYNNIAGTLDKIDIVIDATYNGHWVGETYEFTIANGAFTAFKNGELACLPAKITINDGYISCRVVGDAFGAPSKFIYLVLNESKLEVRTSADGAAVDTLHILGSVIEDFYGTYSKNSYQFEISENGVKGGYGGSVADLEYTFEDGKIILTNGIKGWMTFPNAYLAFNANGYLCLYVSYTSGGSYSQEAQLN